MNEIRQFQICQINIKHLLYHKSSSVMNGPAPHEYGQGSLKNEIQVNAIR